MLSQCEKDIRLYVSLAEKLKEETDQGAVYRMVCRMAVVLAYIKRRLNLVFLLEENDKISAEELGICIGNDSLPCIRQSGVICELTGEIHGLRDISEITFLYESFHGVIMAAFDTLRALTVHLSEQEGKIVMTMHLTGETDLNSLASDRIHVKNNKDEWLLTICDKGGACR